MPDESDAQQDDGPGENDPTAAMAAKTTRPDNSAETERAGGVGASVSASPIKGGADTQQVLQDAHSQAIGPVDVHSVPIATIPPAPITEPVAPPPPSPVKEATVQATQAAVSTA